MKHSNESTNKRRGESERGTMNGQTEIEKNNQSVENDLTFFYAPNIYICLPVRLLKITLKFSACFPNSRTKYITFMSTLLTLRYSEFGHKHYENVSKAIVSHKHPVCWKLMFYYLFLLYHPKICVPPNRFCFMLFLRFIETNCFP